MKLFHRFFYALMRVLVTPYFYLTGYRPKRYRPKSKNYLVLCNHNTNWDFFLYGMVLRKQMYFVASEHIFRKGFVSKLIRFLVDPIPRKKGASGDDTVNAILQRLRRGDNVCMMPEGNRSFSGETSFIPPRTARLVKESGVGLINLAVHGCYLVNPRWSKETRRGPTWGAVVREYTAGELAEMTEEDICNAIKTDLYVDAFADQRVKKAKYRCRRPAEKLESALFLCPCCHDMSSLQSKGDRFFCTACGMETRFNEFGFFEAADEKGPAPVYDTTLDWYRWQLDYLRAHLRENTDVSAALFSDEDMVLSEIHPLQGMTPVIRGRLSLYPDRLTMTDSERELAIPLTDIAKISITQTDTMLFTAAGVYYQLNPAGGTRSALKYLIASRLLAGKEYY